MKTTNANDALGLLVECSAVIQDTGHFNVDVVYMTLNVMLMSTLYDKTAYYIINRSDSHYMESICLRLSVDQTINPLPSLDNYYP